MKTPLELGTKGENSLGNGQAHRAGLAVPDEGESLGNMLIEDRGYGMLIGELHLDLKVLMAEQQDEWPQADSAQLWGCSRVFHNQLCDKV